MYDTARPAVPLPRQAVVDAAGERSARSREAFIRLIGTLKTTPELVPVPHLNDVRTTAQVVAGAYVFSAVARGDAARALNAIGANGSVMIEGHLENHEWTTEDDHLHSTLEICADEVMCGP